MANGIIKFSEEEYARLCDEGLGRTALKKMLAGKGLGLDLSLVEVEIDRQRYWMDSDRPGFGTLKYPPAGRHSLN